MSGKPPQEISEFKENNKNVDAKENNKNVDLLKFYMVWI